MFDSAIYDIFSNFDSNFASYASFVQGEDWVLRVLVNGWETGTPPASRLAQPIAQSIAAVLAVCNDLGLYEVKAVTMQHVPNGEVVAYSKDTWLGVGDGYTDTVVAGDGTWLIDMVFRPKASESSLTGLKCWRTFLQQALVSTQGHPTVWQVALMPLRATSVGEYQSVYDNARSFWSGVQPYWEIQRMKSEAVSPTGYKFGISQINKDVAWSNASYVGQAGIGISLGSAFNPQALQPLSISGTIKQDVVVDPADPSTWEGDTSVADAGLSTLDKGVIVAAGVLVTYGAVKLLLRW